MERLYLLAKEDGKVKYIRPLSPCLRNDASPLMALDPPGARDPPVVRGRDLSLGRSKTKATGASSEVSQRKLTKPGGQGSETLGAGCHQTFPGELL
jgi:hypothetical protein